MRKKAKKFTLLQLIEERVPIRSLLKRVYLNEDNLIEAALEQPDLQKQAGRFRVQRMHKRAMLEAKLEYQKSLVGRKFRRIRDAGGKKEFTEGAVKERIELDPKVVYLRKRLDDAIALEELAKSITEVFRTRSDSLRIIVQMGKISLHAKELAMLRSNKTLRNAVVGLRRSWLTGDSND